MDPLFLKRFQLKTCSETPKKNDWFDAECQSARAKYLDSLRSFNRSHSDKHRVIFGENKNAFKKIVRKKKWLFKKLTELEGLKLKKPREFWKYFKKSCTNSANSISLDEFHKYSSTLEWEINSAENSDAETLCSNYDFDNPLDSNDDLDFPITINEVISAVKKLKTGKSHGVDDILNKYLIETVDILGSHLCDLFNSILESGIFPEPWTEGIVIPIFKKGDKMDCGNYRGITLLSCFSKLFTVLLNRRIMSYWAVNPFPNKPWFLRTCNLSLLKTRREKEKLLVTSNFSFSHSVFYPFGKLSAILIKVKFVVCKVFQFGRV